MIHHFADSDSTCPAGSAGRTPTSEEKRGTMTTAVNNGSTSTDTSDLYERVHAVEVAQATGAATLAGAQATQAAAQAGTTATTTAMQAGTVGMMATGSVALVVGIFLGIVIRSR
jgi:hypothetical protein